jgi:hypothetical protein
LLATHVGDWTLEQLVWLEDQNDSYLFARQDNDLPAFWMFLFADFLYLWPVHKFLWPTMPQYQRLTAAQQRFVIETEEQCRRVSSFSNNIIHPLSITPARL